MSDLISRQALCQYALNQKDKCITPNDIMRFPSAEPKMGRDCTNFVRWLIDEVMDEENWQLNAVANGEIICRKLKKLGLLDVVDGYYVETQKTGEWVEEDEYGDLWVCDQCGFASEYRNNYCPNCGAQMERSEDAQKAD